MKREEYKIEEGLGYKIVFLQSLFNLCHGAVIWMPIYICTFIIYCKHSQIIQATSSCCKSSEMNKVKNLMEKMMIFGSASVSYKAGIFEKGFFINEF